MSSERAFERERDWTQGPAKWAAAVVLGMACVLTSAWVMAGRVRIDRDAGGAEPARALASAPGTDANLTSGPLGPRPEPSIGPPAQAAPRLASGQPDAPVGSVRRPRVRQHLWASFRLIRLSLFRSRWR